MAVLISATSGNWTSPSTWRVGFTPSMVLNYSTGASQNLTTTPANSPTFLITSDVTIEGVLLLNSSRTNLSTSGQSVTMRVLRAGTPLLGATVSIDGFSFPAIQASGFTSHHWVYFKFLNPLTITGSPTVTYSLSLFSSATNYFSFANSVSANNFVKVFVTNIQSAPQPLDTMIVVGHHFPLASNPLAISTQISTVSVIMDNTSSDLYGRGGVAGASFTSVEVGRAARLDYATASGNTYQLNCFGIVSVGGNGIMTMGTTTSPVPFGSTAVLRFASSSVAGALGLQQRQYSYFYAHGASKSGQSLLSVNAATNSTSLITIDNTNWGAGDNLVIAGSVPGPAGFDFVTLSTGAVAQNLTLTNGIQNAKVIYNSPGVGFSATEIEIINLTRNVKISGVSFATHSTQTFTIPSVFDCRYVQFDFNFISIGGPSSGPFAHAYHVEGFRIEGCAFSNHTANPFINIPGISTAIPGATYSFRNTVFYNGSGVMRGMPVFSTFQDTSRVTFSNCWGMRFAPAASTGLFAIQGDNGTSPILFTMEDCRFMHITNNSNHSGVIRLESQSSVYPYTKALIIRRNVFKNNDYAFTIGGNSGFLTSTTVSHIFSDNKFYHNSRGLNIAGQSFPVSGLRIDNYESFGNLTNNLLLSGSYDFKFVNGTVWGGPWTTKSPIGIDQSGTWGPIDFENFYLTGHSSVDVSFGGFGIFRNSFFGSSTPVNNSTITTSPSLFNYVSSSRHNKINGSHFVWKGYGTLRSDTSIYRTPTNSLRMTPHSAVFKVETDKIIAPVKTGQVVTFGVWVRRSVSVDGQAHNGNFPRLICKFNSATVVGPNDIILATATSASTGNWQYISGTLPTVTYDSAFEVVVDCDGTTGWVNVDDFFVSAQNSTKGFKYWLNGAPIPSTTTQLGSAVVFL